MATCPRCKDELDAEARFCGNCGTPTGVVVKPGSPAGAVNALDDTVPPDSSAPLTDVDQLIGRVLNGRYRIDRKLGEGGFGAVFEGVHLQMGRPVAVKVLHPRLTRDPKMSERFRREAQAACNLRDPHTVTTYDSDQAEEGVLYIVMELIRGRSLLQEIQQQGALEPGRAVALLDQVCSALAEAHALDIVHRDIKPENILIEDRPSQPDFIKVVDFGIARIMHDPRGDTVAKLTAAGQIFGTLEYMSPEQLAGGDIDHRVDIYALGAMLYQMLTGVPPFSGTPSQLIAAHLSRDPRPPSALCGAVPTGLDQVVLRCMAKQPADRFADVHALQDAMRQAVQQAPTNAAVVVPPTAIHGAPPPGAPPSGLAPVAPASGLAPALASVAPASVAPASTPPRPVAARPVAARPAPTRPPGPGLPVGAWIGIVLTAVLVLGVGAYAISRAVQRAGDREEPFSGGTTSFAGSITPGSSLDSRPARSTPRWNGEAALLKLVPDDADLALLLRPARLMQLPGVAEVWQRHFRANAQEMIGILAAGPEQMELALLAFPALPEDDADPDGVAVIRGIDAAATLARLRQGKQPETEQYQTYTLHRFPQFALVQLDPRTLLGGTPVTVKQWLLGAGDSDSTFAVDRKHLAHLRLHLPPRLQRELRRGFRLPATSRVNRIVATVTHDAPQLVLLTELSTDSTQTAATLAVWVRQILHNQDAAAAALLRRAAVNAAGNRVVVRLAGQAQELVATLQVLAAESGSRQPARPRLR